MVNFDLEKYDNRLVLRPRTFLGSEGFERYRELCNGIPGVRYSKSLKAQTAPLDLATCRQLRRAFGRHLVLGPAVTEWAKQAVNEEKALQQILTADPRQPMELPRVAAVAPEMHAAIMRRAYQTQAVAFVNRARQALIADQPGLGKTLETFASILEAGVEGAVLVVSPSTSLYPTWAHEVGKWLGEVGAEAFVAGDARLNINGRTAVIEQVLASEAPLRFLMVNPEMLNLKEHHQCLKDHACDGTNEYCKYVLENSKAHKTTREGKYPLLHDTRWAALIGDEVHRYLLNSNPRSGRVTQVGLGLQRLQTVEGGLRIALSGTPMKGKPRKLWGVFRWLRPDLYPSQWRWSQRYFQVVQDAYTGNDQITDTLRPEMESEFNTEVGRMMIRRTKAELRALNPQWAPPEKRYAEVWLPLTKPQERAYKSMQKSAIAALKGGTLSANGVLAEMTRLRQFASTVGQMDDLSFRPTAEGNKYEWLIGTMLPRLGITGDPKTEESTQKVVIASQFTSLIEVWSEALRARGIDTFTVTGKTKQSDRTAIVERWQQPGGPRVLLLNTNAGGVSLTLDYADDLVVLDETWVPDDQEQVEDRVHRTSRTDHQVTIWYVRSEGTIERDLAGSNVMMDDRQKRVLDGRRGIEIARALYNWQEVA